MDRRKLMKTGLMILLIVLAGIFYSCRGIGKPGTTISLQDNGEEQTASHEDADAVQTGEVLDVKQAAGMYGNSSVDAAETANANQPLKELEAEQNSGTISEDTHEYIYIHICGAVKNPDVYEVKADTRLVDIIKLAGGLTKDAAGDYINQAALVEDGQKVYIPTKEEVKELLPDGFLSNSSNDSNSMKSNTSSGKNTAAESSTGSNKVNINIASAEELMTLTGIGEAKAASIIAYRQEHGGFKGIEEIKNISGIKDSVFNKISDRITVN